MEISWQRENGGEDKERESNGKMGHGRWQKAAQNPNPNQLFPQGTTSFPNGSKSAAPSCTAALCWRGTGQGQERNTKGTPVSPQFPRVGTVGTRDGRAKRGARRGGEGANKEASHGSRLRSFLRISTTDHSDARSGFSPTRETRCLLHLCLGQEAQPIGSWLRRNESSWPRRHAQVQKYTCLALSHPNLACGRIIHPKAHRHCSAGSGNQHVGVEVVDRIGGVYGESSRWQSYTYTRTKPPRLAPSPTDAVPNQTSGVPNSIHSPRPTDNLAPMTVPWDESTC